MRSGNPLCITLVFEFTPCSLPPLSPSAPYQGVDILHLHGPTVEDVPAQHDEEEEKAQHHVAHVAEDVVEGTAGKKKV